MFGMGGLIEKAIRDNLVKTYHQLPEIVSRWEAYREELLVKEGDVVGRGMLLAGRPPVDDGDSGHDIEFVRSIMQDPVPLMIKNDNLLPSNAGEKKKNKKEKEAHMISAPRHMRRRTASELVLDALPTLEDLPNGVDGE
jgi:hypothetical protein